jgi:hypothetical protein
MLDAVNVRRIKAYRRRNQTSARRLIEQRKPAGPAGFDFVSN